MELSVRRLTHRLLAATLGLLLLGACTPGEAPEPPAAPGDPAVATLPPAPVNPLGLPETLRGKLRLEMVEIEGAMQRLLDHLVRGEADRVAATAHRIHDSFILEQSLSADELARLRELLPEGFVRLDRAFHETAAELARAGESGDLRGAGQLYGEMVGQCVRCHARHAAERFPGLGGEG